MSSHGVPKFGKVRFTIDWTTEDAQHLLVVSTVDVFSPLSTVVVISVCHAAEIFIRFSALILNCRFNLIERDSFVPQRHQWVYLCCSPRRHEAGQQGHAEQQRRRNRKGQRVGRLDLKEQRFEVTR